VEVVEAEAEVEAGPVLQPLVLVPVLEDEQVVEAGAVAIYYAISSNLYGLHGDLQEQLPLVLVLVLVLPHRFPIQHPQQQHEHQRNHCQTTG
jgi:hypothetical protein